MIDKNGTVKIIDFGSVNVAGVIEAEPRLDDGEILGTAQYTAPEYFVGKLGPRRSDLFSLRVIAYQMLTGKLPYGAQIAKTRTRSQQWKLRYTSAATTIPIFPNGLTERLRRPCISIPTSATRRCQNSSTTFAIPIRASCATSRLRSATRCCSGRSRP